MRRVLIDTNVYVSFKRKNQAIVESFRNLDYIGIDITVLAELYAGFRSGRKEKQNRQELESFINNQRVHILNHNQDTAEFYSQIYHNLKTEGKPIPTNDIWIAAVAMQYGLALFSLDNHFSAVEGLIINTDIILKS